MSLHSQDGNATVIRASASLATIFLATVFLFFASFAFAADILDRTISIDIPANTRLEDALIEWGLKSGMTVMTNTKTVEQMSSRKVQGTFSARKALLLILDGSGLSFTTEGQRILVVPASPLQHSSDHIHNSALELPLTAAWSSYPPITLAEITEWNREWCKCCALMSV